MSTITIDLSNKVVATRNQSVFLQCEEIDTWPQAMQALEVVTHVQGVLSAELFICDSGLFITYEAANDERRIRVALEAAGYRLIQ